MNLQDLTLHHCQQHQPWTVPYASHITESLSECYYLLSTHAVLHAAKSVGKLAAVFEKADHEECGRLDINTIAAMSADLVTVALRLANLHGFDLAEMLVNRVHEKNGVALLDTEE